MNERVLIHVTEAAKRTGRSKEQLIKLLTLPEGSPAKPKHLKLINDEFCDLEAVERFVNHSKCRQGQAPVVDDETMLDAIAESKTARPEGAQDAAILTILSFVGLRVSECCALTIERIVDKNGELRKTTHLYRHETKTNVQRTIYLSDPAVKKYVLPWLQIRILQGAAKDEPLFRTREGLQFTPPNLGMYVKRLYRRLGLGHLSSHSGRAATVTRCLNAGLDLKFAGRVVGHRSVNTTAKYQRLTDDEITATIGGLRNAKA